jgi:hypothetical protein
VCGVPALLVGVQLLRRKGATHDTSSVGNQT